MVTAVNKVLGTKYVNRLTGRRPLCGEDYLLDDFDLPKRLLDFVSELA
jgi:hypothetical protein